MTYWDKFVSMFSQIEANTDDGETQRCQICGKEHDLMQIRMTFCGEFLCDVCVSRSVSSTYVGRGADSASASVSSS